MSDQAQWLRDRAEIEALIILFGRGNDFDPSYYDQCLLEDVEVVYPFGSWKGLAKTKRMRDTTLAVACKFTQHHMTNPIIEINGDVGRGEYYCVCAHGVTGSDGRLKIVYGGVVYIQDVVRTPAGWRVKRHEGNRVWIDDEGGLMRSFGELVSAQMAKG